MNDPRARRPAKFLILILLTLVSLPWLNSFKGTYLFDDSREIEQSPRIKEFLPLKRHFRGQRPLQSLSLALNYKISGFDPWSYHLVNLLIHLASVLVLFLLLRGTLNAMRAPPKWLPHSDHLAFAVALLWGVHPIHTESVTYIVQRSESLMGLFYLAGLWAVMKACQSSRSLPWFFLAALFGSLGMLTKVVIGSLPLMAIFYDRVFFCRDGWRSLKERWRGYVVLTGIWLVPLSTGLLGKLLTTKSASGGGTPGASASAGLSVGHISSMDYLLTESGVLIHYVRLVFLPINQCLDYTWKAVTSISDVLIEGPIVLVTLLLGFFWLQRGRRVGFLIVAFFLILAPTSSVIPTFDNAAEHRMYLSSIAVLVLGILGLCHLLKVKAMRREMVMLLIAVPYCLLAFATFSRNQLYADPVAMWQDVLEVSPENGRALNQLGGLALLAGDLEQAEIWCQKSLAVSPNYGLNSTLMAQIESRRGNYPAALPYAIRGTKFQHGAPLGWLVLGVTLSKVGQHEQAIEAFDKAGLLAPRWPDLHCKKSQVYIRSGQFDLAAKSLERAFREGIDSGEAYSVAATLARRRGDLEEAEANYKKALALDDQSAEIWLNYSITLEAMERYEDALEAAKKALSLKDLARARLQVGILESKLGRYAQARQSFQDLLKLPREAQKGLGQAASMLLRRSAAMAEALPSYSDFLATGWKNADPEKLLLYAEIAAAEKFFSKSVSFYERAFVKSPALANDLKQSYRYKAAWTAVKAKDFKRSLLWLSADLKLRREQIAKGGTEARLAKRALETWRSAWAFRVVRSEEASASWRSFWVAVDQLLEGKDPHGD